MEQDPITEQGPRYPNQIVTGSLVPLLYAQQTDEAMR